VEPCNKYTPDKLHVKKLRENIVWGLSRIFGGILVGSMVLVIEKVLGKDGKYLREDRIMEEAETREVIYIYSFQDPLGNGLTGSTSPPVLRLLIIMLI
jgi:hypothetical protein